MTHQSHGPQYPHNPYGQPTQPQPGGYQHHAYPPPPLPPRRGPLFWLLVVGGILTVLVVIGSLASNSTRQADNSPLQAAPATSAASAAPAVEEAVPEATPTPAPSDFALRVKTLRKACFGSAGCNVTYSIRVTLAAALPDDVSYLVTYRVTGGDDPAVNTFEITGDRVTYTEEERIGTPSSRSVLRAKVTDVEAV